MEVKNVEETSGTFLARNKTQSFFYLKRNQFLECQSKTLKEASKFFRFLSPTLNFQSHLRPAGPKKYGGSLFSSFVVLGGLRGLCFQDTRPASLPSIWHFSSLNHPFLIRCYTHRDAPLVLFWPLCSLVVQHGCLLFFKFTLASGVLLVQEFSLSIIEIFLHVGKTFAKKISRIYMYRNTVPPWLISHHRQEKQHKWMVGEKKKSKLERTGYTEAALFLKTKLAFL